MPLQIQRTATVYRLWDDDDLFELFADHAGNGWLVTLIAAEETGAVVWRVGMQNAARQTVAATRDDVIVSDLVTVTAQTLSEYNETHPDDQIEAGS